MVSACMSGTRGSCVLSSTGDVLVRGVGGMCDIGARFTSFFFAKFIRSNGD